MRTTLELDSRNWPELWQAAYRVLEQSVISTQLQAWIQPLELVETQKLQTSLRICMAAPNDFSAQWVRDHCKSNIEIAFTQVTGEPCELQLLVRESDPEVLSPYETPTQAHSPTGARNPQEFAPEMHELMPETNERGVTGNVILAAEERLPIDNVLDSRYTFDNFVVGASNQFAHASAVAVAEQPAKQYNPLFLYSPPGLGKTHLLYGIGSHLMAKQPGARVAYLSAEKFVNELIDCLQHRRMSQFRKKYRDSYDLILIDDIQFIAGKNTSEEEFFHTFNALHSSKRQIVVTSDRPPKEIKNLAERIRTRFEWGLVADISPPEIETRIAILKAKAEREDIYLPDDVATFLASCIKSNVRELEGVLVKLEAQSSLTGAEISLEMAKQELRTAIPEEGAQFTIENIQNAVAKHFHLKVQDLKSTTRTRTIAEPRQIAMYLIRKYTGMGFKEIGQYFGGKDHTTILYACQKVESAIEAEGGGPGNLRDAVEAIQNLL